MAVKRIVMTTASMKNMVVFMIIDGYIDSISS